MTREQTINNEINDITMALLSLGTEQYMICTDVKYIVSWSDIANDVRRGIDRIEWLSSITDSDFKTYQQKVD